jgi:hypothetical protein
MNDGVVLPELDIEGDVDLLPEVLDAMLEKASENRAYIMRLKQQDRIPSGVLEIVRDMLLEGSDIDAIAILASELGLVPPPERLCAWGLRSPMAIEPNRVWSWNARPNDHHSGGRFSRRWRPMTMALSKRTADAFRIVRIFDLLDTTSPLFEDVGHGPDYGTTGEFFGRYLGSYFNMEREWSNTIGGDIVLLAPQFSAPSYRLGIPLPFGQDWGPDGGGLSLDVVNRSDQAQVFEAMIVGCVISEVAHG